MKQTTLKGTILQWLVPFLVLLAFMEIVVMDFVLTTKSSISLFLEADNKQIGASISKSISDELTAITSISNIIHNMLEADGDEDSLFVMEAIDSMVDTGDAYMAAYYRLDGKSFLSHYVTADLHDAEYLELLQGTENFFTFTSDDGVYGKAAFLYVCPLEIKNQLNGYLITYIDPIVLESVFEQVPYGMDAYYAIVNPQGDILATYGHEGNSAFIQPDFWNALKPFAQNPGYWSVFNNHRTAREVGILDVTSGREVRTLYTFPLNDTEWSVVLCLNTAYIESVVEIVWRPVKELLGKSSVLIILYLLVTIGINVAIRKKSVEENEKLQNEADTDLLTELYNKVNTERKIKEYMEENPQKQGVLFIVDLDDFKKINDTMGHAFGDEVLRSLSASLRTMFRTSDVIGRVGGDEFIVFLKDINGPEVVEREGKRLEKFFREFKVGEYAKYSVSASVGGAVFPTDADSFEALYKAADEALYVSKRSGKSQMSLYHKEKK